MKECDTRKLKILAVAEELFMTKGYIETTISEITFAAHTSRTSFYHYFASKEDLMNQTIERLVDTNVLKAKIIAANSSYTPIQKLFHIMTIPEPGYHFSQDAKLIFYQKKLAESRMKLSPILWKVVEEGRQAGALTVEFAVESIDFLLTAAQYTMNMDGTPDSEKESLHRRKVFIHMMKRILGITYEIEL